ncbi:DUF4232 domain-containing protein [Streptomyces sp. NPDC057555]|uniref:DUF4232 domain-containing protein n=1 Tax=Streptomyces sp. NPDC057555 TaxID=3346166 RepID=UPI0036BC6754
MPRTDATTAARRPRAAHRRALRIAAAGLTAVAALTLTACGQDNPLKTSGAKPFDPAPQDSQDSAADNQPDGQGANASADTADGSAAKGGGSGSGSGGKGSTAGSGKQGTTGGPSAVGRGQGPAARPASCDAAKIRIVAKQLTRPINHLLLVATNTSGATCDLYAAPFLRFDDAQAPVAELPDSKPQAVATLAPGASGYASVLLSGGDGSAHGNKMTSLGVSLAARDGQGSTGGEAKVALPGGSAYVDDSARVTYWQTDPNQATSW